VSISKPDKDDEGTKPLLASTPKLGTLPAAVESRTPVEGATLGTTIGTCVALVAVAPEVKASGIC